MKVDFVQIYSIILMSLQPEKENECDFTFVGTLFKECEKEESPSSNF